MEVKYINNKKKLQWFNITNSKRERNKNIDQGGKQKKHGRFKINYFNNYYKDKQT